MGTLFTPYVKDILDGNAATLGTINSAQAVGGILGGFVAVAAGRRWTPRALFGWGAVVFGLIDLAIFVYPVLYVAAWPAVLGMALVGFPGAVCIAARTTLLQDHSTDEPARPDLRPALRRLGVVVDGRRGDRGLPRRVDRDHPDPCSPRRGLRPRRCDGAAADRRHSGGTSVLGLGSFSRSGPRTPISCCPRTAVADHGVAGSRVARCSSNRDSRPSATRPRLLRSDIRRPEEGPMASKLNPYLQFKDNAREAMTYYQEVFGGDLAINTFNEYGGGGDGVMHSQLDAPNGFTLMASDTPEGMPDASSRRQHHHQPQRRRQRRPARLLGQARRRRPGDDAAGEADVGRRVRHPHRPVRGRLDGQHRREPTRAEPTGASVTSTAGLAVSEAGCR